MAKLGSVFVALAVALQAHALWPLPRQLSTGSSPIALSSGFDINVKVDKAPSDLMSAVSQTKSYLKNDKLEALTLGRGAQQASTIKKAKDVKELTISLTKGATVASIASEAQKPLGQRSEEYILTVPEDGSPATLEANSTLGLFRGLTTFTQLWYYYDGTTYSLEAPVQVTDAPFYPYRGFMLDTARNYFPVSDILRTLDAMSWVKINTFHWHVVDSQSFPLEVPGFENISQQAAYSSSMVYTASDVQNIVNYAGERGIDVLIEIDTPGHEAAIADAYPQHVACNQLTPWASYANEPPAGQLRFAVPETVSFTANLLSAVAKMFPSKYFSTGGDEINVPCYDQDEPTQQALNSSGLTFQEALSNFTVATHSALEKMGKTPVVWEEMVLANNVTLSNVTIVLVWISSEDAKGVAEKGFRIVHAPSNYFYLDCGGGGWVGDNPDGNSWCDPMKTWQYAYSFDPRANLTSDQYDLVLGGQQLLWTEQSGPSNLDPIVWPRAASSAEVFWTAMNADGSALNGTSALPRLHDISFRMAQRGVHTIPLQPLWCALRPHACDLNA